MVGVSVVKRKNKSSCCGERGRVCELTIESGMATANRVQQVGRPNHHHQPPECADPWNELQQSVDRRNKRQISTPMTEWTRSTAHCMNVPTVRMLLLVVDRQTTTDQTDQMNRPKESTRIKSTKHSANQICTYPKKIVGYIERKRVLWVRALWRLLAVCLCCGAAKSVVDGCVCTIPPWTDRNGRGPNGPTHPSKDVMDQMDQLNRPIERI
jgi:hypothetical protein